MNGKHETNKNQKKAGTNSKTTGSLVENGPGHYYVCVRYSVLVFYSENQYVSGLPGSFPRQGWRSQNTGTEGATAIGWRSQSCALGGEGEK
jgi:hypothetical protein